MFREGLYDQFSKIVEKYKLKQLYILLFIPVVFLITKLFYELSFHDTFLNQLFLILVACILCLSAILGFLFNERKKYTFAINSILLIGCIIIPIWCYYLYKPPQLPDDKLVVLIAKFTPVSSGAEEDSENIPHRIEQELQKKQTEGIPLEIKRMSKQVLGTNKYSKRDCAIKIGSSKEGYAHVILWGDVRKDESELYVTPNLTIIKKMKNVNVDDREIVFSNKENNHIDFKELIAKEISNITAFVCGLAYYEAKKWDEAIQIFDRIPSDEGQFYKGLCLYDRAFTTEQPKQELLGALRIFSNIFESNKSDISKFKEELYFGVQRHLVQTLIELSNLSEPQIGLDYLYNAEKISELIYNYLAESIQKDENSRLNHILNLYLAHEDLGMVLSRLGEVLSGDEGISYLEDAIKIYNSAQTNILQKLVYPQWQAATLSNLGVAFLNLGKRLGIDNGKEYMEKAIESHRNALEILQKNKLITKGDVTYYNLALALSNLGEMISGENGIKLLKESIMMLEKSLELNKKEEFPAKWASIQNVLGGAFFNLSSETKDEELLLKSIDKFQEALTVFDHSKFPRNWADTHHNIGLALSYRGITINSSKSADYFNEAILNFKDALSVYEGQKNTNTYNIILKMTANAYSNWGIALNNQGMFDKAIEKFEKATEMDPRLADAYSNWGSALTHFRKYDEAIEKFKKAIEINPQHAIAYYNWGTALNNLGMFDKAIEKFEKAAEINPQIADYYSDWGFVLLNQGKLNEAIEKLKKATEINPQHANAYYNWGIALGNLGVFDKAIVKFEKATEINPQIADYYSNWGIALNNLGMFDKAIEKFEKATQIDPQLADAYTNWGAALTHFRKYDEAIEKFKEATEINPQLAIAYYNWGTALNNLGMFDNAIEKFEKATEIAPQIADYYSSWENMTRLSNHLRRL